MPTLKMICTAKSDEAICAIAVPSPERKGFVFHTVSNVHGSILVGGASHFCTILDLQKIIWDSLYKQPRGFSPPQPKKAKTVLSVIPLSVCFP